MRDKVLNDALKEVVAQPESGQPDLWIWLLLPAIGLTGSFIVVVTGWSSSKFLDLPAGVWVWVMAVAVPGLLFARDIHGYQVARRDGRRAGWRLRHAVADEAAGYLRDQRAATIQVNPARERRLIPLNSGKGQNRLIALENEAVSNQGEPADQENQKVRWLQSPHGRRVNATTVTLFLRRAYRMGTTARRQHEPAHMTRDEYTAVMAFLVDCGICEDKGQSGRPLQFETFAEAMAHLHINTPK